MNLTNYFWKRNTNIYKRHFDDRHPQKRTGPPRPFRSAFKNVDFFTRKKNKINSKGPSIEPAAHPKHARGARAALAQFTTNSIHTLLYYRRLISLIRRYTYVARRFDVSASRWGPETATFIASPPPLDVETAYLAHLDVFVITSSPRPSTLQQDTLSFHILGSTENHIDLTLPIDIPTRNDVQRYSNVYIIR